MLETKMVVDIYKDGIFQITKVLYQWILKKKYVTHESIFWPLQIRREDTYITFYKVLTNVMEYMTCVVGWRCDLL